MPAKKKWDKESVKTEALKYDGRRKFKLGAAGAYKFALRLGIMDQVCAHMKGRNWTQSSLMKIAKQYTSLRKFRTEQKGAYLHACRKGYLEEATQHMNRELVRRGHWTKERCHVEAKKYEYRSEFMRQSGSAYNISLKRGWLDEICVHMRSPADGYHHCIYVILNERYNLAYVGITRQLFNARMKAHQSDENTTTSKRVTQLPDTQFIRLTDYEFDASEVKDVETHWVNVYKGKGYGILNDENQLGRTGTSNRIHTDEAIYDEAKKYKKRVEFKKKSPKIYDAAVSQQLLDKACSHMRGIAKKNYWDKEKCIQFAGSCSNRNEFVQSRNGAYGAALKNGWLDEVYAKVRSKYDMSWLLSGTRKDVWCKADDFYDVWVKNNKCGMHRMRTLTNFNLDKMLKKFKKGWVPAEDSEWREWADKIKLKLVDE